MPPARGPLGDLPGLTYDPVKNRYFPTPKEEQPKKPAAPKDTSVRGSFQQRLKNRRADGPSTAKSSPEERQSRKSIAEKEDRRSRRAKEGKAVTSARNDIDISLSNESSLATPRRAAANRIDRALLRATGLQLGHHDRFSGPTFAESQRRQRRERGLRYSRMASITADDEPTFPSTLTVMATIPDQPSAILLGDHMGSIHAVKMEYDIPDWEMGEADRPAATESSSPPRHRRWLWQEINLGKRITGIRATREHYIATTFGPRPRIVVSQLPAMLSAFDSSSSQPPFLIEEEKPTVLWELTKMQDAWSMDSVGSSVIVGGNQQIVYSQDVINPQFRSIRTPGNSDALSVCQINTNEALVGLRSSAILHFDFRLPDSSAIATRLELGKSVCGLKFLDQSGAAGRSVIASGYTHQLALFDLRFPKKPPLQRYTDHVNDYRSGLGLAVDPSQTHLFAAGSDQIIRAWSIWDGQPVSEYGKQSESSTRRKLLGTPHSALINGIEVAEEDKIHILTDRQLETYMQYQVD